MEYYTPTFIKNKMNAIKRVRELHTNIVEGKAEFNYCLSCKGEYPCPTIQALDGK